MSYNHASILDRYVWWASLNHGGLLIAPAKLAEFFPAQAEPLPRYLADRLRRDVTRLQNGDAAHLGPLLDTVLEEVLALDKAWWLKGPAVENRWGQKAATGETIKPRRVWQPPAEEGATLPVFTSEEARLGVGRGRRAASRVVEWLRKAGLKLALLTNGHQWRLIHAGADYDAWAEWDIDFWFAEGQPGPQVDALRLLMGRFALSTPEQSANHSPLTIPNSPLMAAIAASRQGQAELSSVLGERVRQAVELLIRESSPNIDALINNSQFTIDHSQFYIAASRVIMRCVVILFAEARELLPLTNPPYHQSYGLQGLREQLDRRAGGRPERLRHSFSAWPRLLALFRLVYFGSDHGDLAVPRYGGGLFAPGDPADTDPVQRALTAFERLDPCPSDAAVYRLLALLTRSQVKVRQGRGATWVEAPVDFSDLSSEYIGILYEGLLDFELRRAEASEPLLFLNLGDQPALPLSRLEAMDDKSLAALLGNSELGIENGELLTEEEEEEDNGELLTDDEAEGETEAEENSQFTIDHSQFTIDDDDLTAQTHTRALTWATRAAAAAKLPAEAAPKLIARLILPGEWFLVRWGGTRKGSGTFYTRPQLAVPTVRRTLEPLVYDRDQGPGAGDQAETEHATRSTDTFITPAPLRPRSPAEILALKICDPAMGSGSFLIAALRYLTAALYESLHAHGHIQAHGAKSLCRLPDGRATNSMLEETIPFPPDHPEFEPYTLALLRRHVVERCLYGIDLNPLAVELARLALWVETMDRRLPFEFLDHKLKCGNALVGGWFDRFRDYPVMAWEREGGDKSHSRFVHHFRTIETAAKKSGKPKTTQKGDVWTEAIKVKKNEVIKPEMIRWLQAVAGQTDFSERLGQSPDALQRRQQQTLGDIHATPAHEPERKAALYRQAVLDNTGRQRLKLAFDTWCALWFWPGDRLDEAPLPRDFFDPGPAAREIIAGLTARHRFFHWELEYPDVFTAESTGFDAVIGNPPWEILKPNSKEFFSNHDPLYRTYGKQEALRRQDELFAAHPAIEREWLAYNAGLKSLSNWSKYAAAPFGDIDRDGDVFSFTRTRAQNEALHTVWRQRRARFRSYADAAHPFAHQGSADLNSYKMFTELAYALLQPGGRLGLIIPSGIYTDKGTADLRALFLQRSRWEWLFGFENRDGIFDIHRSFKFCPIIVTKGGQTRAINAAFMQRSLAAWEEAERHAIPYRAEQVTRFSPGTRAILEVPTATDLAILEKLYAHGVLLGDDSPAGWGIQYAREFDMTTDSKLFPPRPHWEAGGYRPDEYGHWLKGRWRPAAGVAPAVGQIFSRDDTAVIAVADVDDVALPLYQGGMIHQFDPCAQGYGGGSGHGVQWKFLNWDQKEMRPQYLIALSQISGTNIRNKNLRTMYRYVANPTNTRTMIATVGLGFPAGHTIGILTVNPSQNAMPHFVLSAILNSFSYDWLLRLSFGGSGGVGALDPSKFFDLPIPKVHDKLMMQLGAIVLQLSGATEMMANWWERQKLSPLFQETPWRQLWAITPHERLRLRCILDAVVAHLYGLTPVDFAWILRDCDHPAEQTRNNAFTRALDPKGFWRVDKEQPPELRHPVLAQIAFAELQRLGLDAFLAQHHGEGWQLPESLRLADYGLGHDERAREAQPVAAALGPRFLPWQLAQSVAESWAECARHAENLRLLLGGSAVEGESPPDDDGPTDLFGQPLQRDLFGNVVYPSKKGGKR